MSFRVFDVDECYIGSARQLYSNESECIHPSCIVFVVSYKNYVSVIVHICDSTPMVLVLAPLKFRYPQEPSLNPTLSPTLTPTMNPTLLATDDPTDGPTLAPVIETDDPTIAPTYSPTEAPVSVASKPTRSPTSPQTSAPSRSDSLLPTSVSFAIQITLKALYRMASC